MDVRVIVAVIHFNGQCVLLHNKMKGLYKYVNRYSVFHSYVIEF